VIDFRYHLVSLISVFLALALGLFLGSTTLQSTVTHSLKSQANRVLGQNRTDEANLKQANIERDALAGFTSSLQPYVVAGRLSGKSVALVSAPGVDGGDRSDLIKALTQAGATVNADIELQTGFLDSSQDAELGQLAKELAHKNPLPQANGATEAAYELARAIVTRPGAQAPGRSRITSILSTFTAGKMISVSGQPPVRQASLAVLLVPGAAPTTASQAGASSQSTILISVAEQLRASSTGVVMAGPSIDPTLPAGPIKVARADSTLTKSVSTVDAIDLPAGRIATVLALAAAPSGRVGNFGLSTKTPVVSPSPTP
jgi:hypothetical protein